MQYCVDYVYSCAGTVHIEANSKEEAEAMVKKMWENLEITTDDDDIDPDTFEVCDVQPENKKKYRVTVQETRTYEGDIYALDYDSAISEAKQLDPDKNCTLVRQVFAEPEDKEEQQ